MKKRNLQDIINYIINKTVQLKNKYTDEKNLEIDYVCIFSQSDEEYKNLKEIAGKDGELVWDSPTGPVYKYHFNLKEYHPNLLRIRISDKTRPERGDVDFNTNYLEFKEKYSKSDGFNLIVREEYEMLELMDKEFDVRVYFSSTPLSKSLGVLF